VRYGSEQGEGFRDSRLVVQQVKGEIQHQDWILNACWEECWHVIRGLDDFAIAHVPREEDGEANMLAQWASGYDVTGKIFSIKEQLVVPSEISGDGESSMGDSSDSLVVEQGKGTMHDRGLNKASQLWNLVLISGGRRAGWLHERCHQPDQKKISHWKQGATELVETGDSPYCNLLVTRRGAA
jgi:hypothetical protein